MALNTETGTGSSTSESYCSVTDASAYHSNRGNNTWALLTTAQMEEALRRATDYMLQVYKLRWKGSRVKSTQALDWPRAFVVREDFYSTSSAIPDSVTGEFYYPSDIVPAQVRDACALLAIKAAAGDLSPDLSRATIREKVDVLEVEYDKSQPQYVRYRAIDNLLAEFLEDGSSGTFRKVLRA